DQLHQHHRRNQAAETLVVVCRPVAGDIAVHGHTDADLRNEEVVDRRPAEIPDAEADLADVPVDLARHDEAGDDEHEMSGPAGNHIPGETIAPGEVVAARTRSGSHSRSGTRRA